MNVSLVAHGISLPPHASATPHGASPAPSGARQATAGNPAAADPARNEQLQEAVNTVNKFIEPAARNLEFQIDAQSGRTVMKLVDKETGSVLRQLPSEEILAIRRALDKLSGLVVHLKA